MLYLPNWRCKTTQDLKPFPFHSLNRGFDTISDKLIYVREWFRKLVLLTWKKKCRQSILMKFHIKCTVNNKHMSSLRSCSFGKRRLIAFRIVSLWARCNELGNPHFVHEENLPVNQKVLMSQVRKGDIFFLFSPFHEPWNEMKTSNKTDSIADHLLLILDVSRCIIKMRHAATRSCDTPRWMKVSM